MGIPVVLAIGGVDPSGTDGIAADLRTCAALGVHCAAAATLIAVDNIGWAGAEPLAAATVEAQIRAVLADLDVAAVKVGALGNAETVEAVAGVLKGCRIPVVADPCFARPGDAAVADEATVAAWRGSLLPLATAVTPNLAEAALLTGTERAATLGEMVRQGEAILDLGCPHAVVSGGHGRAASSTDILVSRIRAPLEMRGERFGRAGLRGLSATLATAIAAHLAHGLAVYNAIHVAKLFVSSAIGAAGQNGIGRGPQPVPQMHRMWARMEPESA